MTELVEWLAKALQAHGIQAFIDESFVGVPESGLVFIVQADPVPVKGPNVLL